MEKRTSYYLGPLLPSLECSNLPVSSEYLPFDNRYYSYINQSSTHTNTSFMPGESGKIPPSYYVEEVSDLLRELNETVDVSVLRKDNQHHLFRSAITKNRIIGSPNAVLLRLNKKRNWRSISEFLSSDKPFEKKVNKVVWRGATTGRWGAPFLMDIRNSQRYQLMRAVMNKSFNGSRYIYDSLCDLGVTDVLQGVEKILSEQESSYLISSFVAPRLSPACLLDFKFVLCLQGNDISTSLKWALSANVVPIMPLPLYESWLMEGRLTPWQHFVPVKEDFRDLLQVVDFLLSSSGLCQYIINEGKRWMLQFNDAFIEHELELKVLSQYCSYIKNRLAR